VLSWRLSNTLDAGFCIEALEEALEHYDPPQIFNTAYSAPSRTPIPRQAEQVFRAKPNTDSRRSRTVIPRQGEQFREPAVESLAGR
jgi:hypothetical protein